MKRLSLLLGLWAALMSASLPLAAAAPASFKAGELHFDRPESWAWIPTQSPMRKAQLAVPAASGEPGEVVFFHFGASNGGGTQANVDRWFSQFEGSRQEIKARTEEAKAGANKVTYVFAEGTYLSGMPGGPRTPKPGFAMLGAIVEDSGGFVFVRFTGPKATVESGTTAFKKMIAESRR
jgi:hypothetical protein